MTTVLLVSRDAGLPPRLARVLGEGLHLLPVRSLAAGPEPGGPRLPVDVVVVDVGSVPAAPEELARARRREDAPVLVGLLPADDGADLALGDCDLLVPSGAPDAVLAASLAQAVRLRRLQQEVAWLRRERARETVRVPSGPAEATGLPATVVKEIGKLLATRFDLTRVATFFLDAVGELVGPARAALLLPGDGDAYRVQEARGLDPRVRDQVRFRSGEGLVAWLHREAGVARLASLERAPDGMEAARELEVLGAEVAIPLWAEGRLVGILAVGRRVTGQPYGDADLERLYTLAGQVGVAIADIERLERARAQHRFVEQVLAHLATGVVTVDRGGRVTLVNPRAAELLRLDPGELVGQDLRALPSPLGDLLYETVRGGRERRLEEVSPAPRPGVALEVSTSRLLGPAGEVTGAVLLLEDPAPRHRLQREREANQTVDLLNRVLIRLTDEIKNPLVSIYTFLELLPQRYDDPEFRETFFTVVSQDTHNLISLVDKLITLAGEREYKLEFVRVRELLEDALEGLALRMERPRTSQDASIVLLEVPERGDRLTTVLYAPHPDLVIRGDRDQLGKALGYLLRFLLSRVAADGRLAIHATVDPDNPQAVRLALLGKPASLTREERERLFSVLAIASERLLDVGPSVSQKIIEGHGGTLTVGGEPEEIRFLVTLPRTTP